MSLRRRGPLPDDAAWRGEREGVVPEPVAGETRVILDADEIYPYEQEPGAYRIGGAIQQENKMTEQEQPKLLEVLNAPPESQFSMNWTMLDGYGANVQLTMRANHLAEWPDVFRTRAAFLELAQKNGWTFTTRAQAPAPHPTVAAPAPVGGPVAPVAPVAASDNGTQAVTTNLLKIEPLSTGKVKLGFWNAGRKYAEITAHKLPAEALALLRTTGQWTMEQMQKAGEYTLPVRIEWRASENTNTNGNPYKNIVAVHPA